MEQHLKIRRIPQSYRRYGYGLSDCVARKFLCDWMNNYKYTDRFESIGIKITNSGMAAIDLCLNVLTTDKKRDLIRTSDLYYASDELIDFYKDRLLGNIYFIDENRENLPELIKKAEHPIVYIERCVNSPNMSFWDNKNIFEIADKVDYVILDGTLIGAGRIHPEIFKKENVVYVESLSKNYHQKESSHISAGIIAYNRKLDENVQRRLFCSGIYLQINDILQIPYELFHVGKDRIFKISQKVKKFYIEAKKVVDDYKDIEMSKISLDYDKIPVVLFLDFKKKEKVERFIKESGIKQRGSFGHDETYILPIGLMWDTAPPGLVRLAFGAKDKNKNLLEALKKLYEV